MTPQRECDSSKVFLDAISEYKYNATREQGGCCVPDNTPLHPLTCISSHSKATRTRPYHYRSYNLVAIASYAYAFPPPTFACLRLTKAFHYAHTRRPAPRTLASTLGTCGSASGGTIKTAARFRNDRSAQGDEDATELYPSIGAVATVYERRGREVRQVSSRRQNRIISRAAAWSSYTISRWSDSGWVAAHAGGAGAASGVWTNASATSQKNWWRADLVRDQCPAAASSERRPGWCCLHVLTHSHDFSTSIFYLILDSGLARGPL